MGIRAGGVGGLGFVDLRRKTYGFQWEKPKASESSLLRGKLRWIVGLPQFLATKEGYIK